MKKKKRIAVLVAIALAVPGVENWDRQAADAMTADTAQSSVADITESANQAELYHKVYKENTAGHISYSLQDDTGNTLSRYTSSAAAKNKRSMARHFQRAMIRVEQSRKRQFAISRIQVPVGRLEH